jgi:TatD DNase family protein
MRLFDTHTHIQGPEYDADRDETVQRAREAGMTGLLVLGWDVSSTERAIGLAERHDDVLAAAGCHPHSADEIADEGLAKLARLAEHPRVAAVGEIGLDFYRNLSQHGRQIDVFRSQLETAAALGKPVAIHCREAHETCLPIIEEWSRSLGGRLPDGRPLGVLHYFSGDADLGQRYIELGLLISVHTSVTHPRSDQLRDVARRLPLDRLVVETDSPYGAPQSMRGKRNEPAYVLEAVREIARLRDEPVERVADLTTDNARRLLGLTAPLRAMRAAQGSA